LKDLLGLNEPVEYEEVVENTAYGSNAEEEVSEVDPLKEKFDKIIYSPLNEAEEHYPRIKDFFDNIINQHELEGRFDNLSNDYIILDFYYDCSQLIGEKDRANGDESIFTTLGQSEFKKEFDKLLKQVAQEELGKQASQSGVGEQEIIIEEDENVNIEKIPEEFLKEPITVEADIGWQYWYEYSIIKDFIISYANAKENHLDKVDSIKMMIEDNQKIDLFDAENKILKALENSEAKQKEFSKQLNEKIAEVVELETAQEERQASQKDETPHLGNVEPDKQPEVAEQEIDRIKEQINSGKFVYMPSLGSTPDDDVANARGELREWLWKIINKLDDNERQAFKNTFPQESPFKESTIDRVDTGLSYYLHTQLSYEDKDGKFTELYKEYRGLAFGQELEKLAKEIYEKRHPQSQEQSQKTDPAVITNAQVAELTESQKQAQAEAFNDYEKGDIGYYQLAKELRDKGIKQPTFELAGSPWKPKEIDGVTLYPWKVTIGNQEPTTIFCDEFGHVPKDSLDSLSKLYPHLEIAAVSREDGEVLVTQPSQSDENHTIFTIAGKTKQEQDQKLEQAQAAVNQQKEQLEVVSPEAEQPLEQPQRFENPGDAMKDIKNIIMNTTYSEAGQEGRPYAEIEEKIKNDITNFYTNNIENNPGRLKHLNDYDENDLETVLFRIELLAEEEAKDKNVDNYLRSNFSFGSYKAISKIPLSNFIKSIKTESGNDKLLNEFNYLKESINNYTDQAIKNYLDAQSSSNTTQLKQEKMKGIVEDDLSTQQVFSTFGKALMSHVNPKEHYDENGKISNNTNWRLEEELKRQLQQKELEEGMPRPRKAVVPII